MITCPNKKIKSSSIQTLSDWETLSSHFGEIRSMAFFISNKEVLPTFDEINALIALDEKKTKERLAEEEKKIDVLFKELQNVENNAEFVKKIDRFYNLVSHQIRELLNKKQSQLTQLLTNKNKSLELTTIQTLIGRANKLKETAEGIAKKQRALAVGVVKINYLADVMKETVRAFLSDKESALQNMDDFQDYFNTIKQWESFLNDAKTAFQTNKEGNENKEFVKTIDLAIGKIKSIERFIIKNDTTGLIKALKPVLTEPLQKYSEYLDRVIESERKVQARTKDALTKNNIEEGIKKLEALKKKIDLENDETIISAITSNTNSISTWIEPFRDSPNIAVAGFDQFVEEVFNKTNAIAHPILMNYEQELKPLTNSIKDRFNVASLSNRITAIDPRISSSGKEFNKLQLLDNFAGTGIRKEKQKLLNNLRNTKEALRDNKDEASEKELREKYREAKKELEQHLVDYWFTPFTKEWYDKNKLWNDELGEDLRADADEILDNISHVQDFAQAVGRDLLPEEAELIKHYWRQYILLGNVNNFDGSPKTGKELEKAERMQEIRALNRKLYTWNLNLAKFERNRYDAIQTILTKFPKDSEEYNTALKEWTDNNTATAIEQEFYETRDAITSEISDIQEDIADEDLSDLFEEIGDTEHNWNTIKSLVYGNRDENNQPIGTQIQEEGVERIKEATLNIQRIKDAEGRASGLTKKESAELSSLFAKEHKTIEDKDRIDALKAKQSSNKLSKAKMQRLKELYKQLQELQSTLPTDYYIDAFNNISQKYGVTLTDSGHVLKANGSVEDILESRELSKLLKNSDFKKWFEANHIEEEFFDADTKEYGKRWKRLHLWNKIVPNDEKYLKKTVLEDGTVINGVPTMDFYYKTVKPEYVVEQDETNTDNKGDWMPKTVEQGAVDNTYINPEYERLQNSTDPTDQKLFQILQIHTKNYLEGQEFISNPDDRNGLDLPDVRKSKRERNIELVKGGITQLPKNLKDRVFSWVNAQNDFNSDTGNAKKLGKEKTDYEKEVKQDIFTKGLTANMIPIKLSGNLDENSQTRDLTRAISKYIYSSINHNELAKVVKFADAVEKIIANEPQITQRQREFKEPNAAKSLRYLIKNKFKGQSKALELGEAGEVVANLATTLAHQAFIPFGVSSSIANIVTGIDQNIVNAGGGLYSSRQYIYSLMHDAPQLWASYMKDRWDENLGEKSLNGQKSDLWEYLQGDNYEEGVGENYTKTILNAATAFELPHRKWGEIIIQSSAWITMMKNHKITTTDGQQISLWDMYEKDDKGIIKLKDNVDPEWGFDGKLFNAKKKQFQQVNRAIQGAMAKSDANMASQYTSFRLVMFLNRWLVTPTINAYAHTNRTINEGYSATKKIARGTAGVFAGVSTAGLLSIFSPVIAIPYGLKVGFAVGLKVKSIGRVNISNIDGVQFGRNMAALSALAKFQEAGAIDWNFLTKEEQIGLVINAKQIGVLLMINLAMLALGGAYGGDDDKEKRRIAQEIIKNNNLVQNQLLLQAMRHESEMVSLDNPATYFNLFGRLSIIAGTKKWADFSWSAIKDLGKIVTKLDLDAYDKYQKDYGGIKEGTSKTYVKLLKATGLQSISNTFDEDDLGQYLKTYDALNRRN